MRLHDDIHNYYEKIVTDHISKLKLDSVYNDDILADLCCTVLNQLPPRYIRYEVDMAFYLTLAERNKMQQQVEQAIDIAIREISKKKALS
ncbi:late competence development ComFB family protein [Pseudoalteromonas sp. MMG010]|uniref:late competence development ComFB family protein n=1 Tax=Pseudoalteromonas sp. MMG010 TaxID=2822685 RepID=UPI001B3A2DE6|nr:late competence development ComFB family protein [Pseudoalteromonas sp. MMG010]MBQ4831670.1 late competence development ComFB family protein [Pseudoalteromonas sp. MMG010]